MKNKVAIMTRGYPVRDFEPADEVRAVDGDRLQVFYKGKSVGVVNNYRNSVICAWVVKPKRKRWKLKLVKE